MSWIEVAQTFVSGENPQKTCFFAENQLTKEAKDGIVKNAVARGAKERQRSGDDP